MAKRNYNWIGGAQNIEPETDAGTTTTERGLTHVVRLFLTRLSAFEFWIACGVREVKEIVCLERARRYLSTVPRGPSTFPMTPGPAIDRRRLEPPRHPSLPSDIGPGLRGHASALLGIHDAPRGPLP